MEYTTDLYIVKRDGKRAPFSIEKIKNAIRKAFLASGSFATEETLTNILPYNPNIHYMPKGNLADKEEFSIFQNEHSGEKLRVTIKEFEHFDRIDVCGIATDYCVYETVKDLMDFYPAKQIRIITNCLAAVDESDTKLADLMKKNGIEGVEL